MRFRGGGVGHKSTREASNFFKKDRDKLDDRSGVDIDDDEAVAEEVTVQPTHEEEDVEEEDNYGYAKSDSESENEVEGMPSDEDGSTDEYFGPEDDGGAVDPDMDELGYADL